jgi:23S rRNA (cytidine2498-2'-O)-methyltransferase
MGFPVETVLEGSVDELIRGVRARVAQSDPAETIWQVWAPDVTEGRDAFALATSISKALALPPAPRAPSPMARLAQVCCLSGTALALGEVRLGEAVSPAPGGRRRMQRPGEAPSRAAMKLEEGLDWLGRAPGKGERCADLGAAPGGWTQRLVARAARVVAVDPGALLPSLAGHRLVHHVRGSAFSYEPDEPMDWLFCDMAWRPLEVAQLLAKWARRGWAWQLLANIKLPMKDKNPVLFRVRQTLESGGWKNLKMRQLYHDRDEVTVTATAGAV